VNSQTPGKLPTSLQFLKFIAQVPHLNIDQSLFFQYCQSCLEKFFTTEYCKGCSYLTEHNPIDKRRYCFRENHSTDLAITTIYDELLRNLENKLITCSSFLDLSKAFDCGDHAILLDKLNQYGIRGVSHKLFSNFLHNRMQCTKIGVFKSSYKRISCGFPQGSVISPLLFLTYITDITKASSFHTTLFADDINLYMSNSCFNVLQTTVNFELCKIDHWLRANKLCLNYNKTNFMLLTSRKHNPAWFNWGSALLVEVFVILCREFNKFVSVYCFHVQAHIMVLLRRMQKQLWSIAHQLVIQLPTWNSFVSGCFIPLRRLLKWITVKFLTYTIASTRVALTGCNMTPAQDGYT